MFSEKNHEFLPMSEVVTAVFPSTASFGSFCDSLRPSNAVAVWCSGRRGMLETGRDLRINSCPQATWKPWHTRVQSAEPLLQHICQVGAENLTMQMNASTNMYMHVQLYKYVNRHRQLWPHIITVNIYSNKYQQLSMYVYIFFFKQIDRQI